MAGTEAAAKSAAHRLVAAIDVGSNSVRMLVAQVSPTGDIEVLEQLQRAVRLGQDTFRRGRLSIAAMRAAIAILRDYRRLIDFYKVEKVRAVATSAVREAANADTFLDRIYMATGFEVEVITTSEESRLTVAAVLRKSGEHLSRGRRQVLLAEVGGGSTLLTVLEEGHIVGSLSLQLGAIRLLESIGQSAGSPERVASLLRQQVANTFTANRPSLPIAPIRTLVAVGSFARFVARVVGAPTDFPDLLAVPRDRFDEVVERCAPLSAEELGRELDLPFSEAEGLAAALIIHQELLAASQAREMLVSQMSMREGLLIDVAHSSTESEDEALSQGIIHTAESLAEKYHADMAHARHVAALAVRLFDELQSEHGMGPRQRLLMQVAGILHDIGGFVSPRGHHKHSFYLVANSEIFGLSREDLQIVAHVARYHRRSPPKPTHVEFMSLPRPRRMVISKLAALLRVADALDRSHSQAVRSFTVMLGREELVIEVPGLADLALERLALGTKIDMFEDVYGLKLRVEDSGGGGGGERPRRAAPVAMRGADADEDD